MYLILQMFLKIFNENSFTTTVFALLAIGLLKITNSSSNDNIIENPLAQLDSESSTMKENDIKMMRNDTSE